MNFRAVVRGVRQLKVNRVVKFLILSDVILFASYSALAPIFAVFILDTIPGATVQHVGIAAALYMFVRALAEMPVGYLIDKTRSEHDNFVTMIAGSLLFSLCFLLYMFVDSLAQLYAVQVLLGLSGALAFPGWYSIFTRHVDRRKMAFEWSLYDFSIALGVSVAALLGAYIVMQTSFTVLFAIMAGVNLLGTLLLLPIRHELD